MAFSYMARLLSRILGCLYRRYQRVAYTSKVGQTGAGVGALWLTMDSTITVRRATAAVRAARVAWVASADAAGVGMGQGGTERRLGDVPASGMGI